LVFCLTLAGVVFGSLIALLLWTGLMMGEHRRMVRREEATFSGFTLEDAKAGAKTSAFVMLQNECRNYDSWYPVINRFDYGFTGDKEGVVADYEYEDTVCHRTDNKKLPFACTAHLKGYCEWNEYPRNGGQLRQEAKSAPADDRETSVRSTIDRIGRGPHQELPATRSLGAPEGQGAGWDITNNTRYKLHVYVSGPVDREVTIPAGESETLDMPPGSYRIAASVDDSSVAPFYGNRTLPERVRWRSSFLIRNY
jgi:hypothetical protein